MNTKVLLPLLFISVTSLSCQKEHSHKDTSDTRRRVEVINSLDAYNRAVQDRSTRTSDPFALDTLFIAGDSLKITVSYPGGCARHSFDVVWNELISSTNPPVLNLLILHNAHNDNCEAMITTTLSVALSELNGITLPEGVSIHVANGYTPLDSLIWVSEPNEVLFTESDQCNTLVTAENVLCGSGLYGNLWFALESSLHNPHPGGFHAYLRPVAIDASLTSFRPVAGRKYRIGARKTAEAPDSDGVECLAWPGPSETVVITCIEEVE